MEGILEGPALWGLLESAKNVLSLWHCILCSVFWILDIKSFLNNVLVIPHSGPGIFSITRDLKIESFKPCHLVFVFIRNLFTYSLKLVFAIANHVGVRCSARYCVYGDRRT